MWTGFFNQRQPPPLLTKNLICVPVLVYGLSDLYTSEPYLRPIHRVPNVARTITAPFTTNTTPFN